MPGLEYEPSYAFQKFLNRISLRSRMFVHTEETESWTSEIYYVAMQGVAWREPMCLCGSSDASFGADRARADRLNF